LPTTVDGLKLFGRSRLIERPELGYLDSSKPEPEPHDRRSEFPPLMNVDDFLCWEGDGTGTRYELIDGVLRAMAPTTNAHGIIVSNLNGILYAHLRGSRCLVVTAPGIRPAMRADWNFRIPDLGVTCEGDRKGERIVTEPKLLIEVLSPSNAADTYENIRAYATLSSIQELLVVHSTRMEVELLRKGDGNIWPANPTISTAGDLRLDSIELTLPLADVYAGTHLVG
jgi:Uma2 family endonuclease